MPKNQTEPTPANTDAKKVVKKTIRWGEQSWSGLWAKQTSETQEDAFGTLIREVTLVTTSADGKPVKYTTDDKGVLVDADNKPVVVGEDGEPVKPLRISLQEEGKPVEGVMPTYERQLVKLFGSLLLTGGNTAKGRGYARVLGQHLDDFKTLMTGLEKAGYCIEYIVGKNGTYFVSPMVAVMFATAIANIDLKSVQYFATGEAKTAAAPTAAVVEEEVALSFIA